MPQCTKERGLLCALPVSARESTSSDLIPTKTRKGGSDGLCGIIWTWLDTAAELRHHLHQPQRQSLLSGKGVTKTGKERFFFSRRVPAASVSAVPTDYEITESVNGVVSLRRSGCQAIRPGELQLVADEIDRHDRLRGHRAASQGKAIVVHEPLGCLAGAFMNSISRHPGRASEDRAAWADPRQVQYSAVMRFVLLDASSREFEAQRMCYRGGGEGWLPLDGGPLRTLARKYVPYNGTEKFFDLCRGGI